MSNPLVPFPHPYADCSRCSGAGVEKGWYGSGECTHCRIRWNSVVKLFGPEKAEAQRRILAIEKELSYATNLAPVPKEIRRSTRKPLSPESSAWVQDYFLSDVNREYLRCLKTWWA